MDGLTVGRIVHYIAYGTPHGEYAAGAHRAAIVAEVKDPAMGVCILAVFNPTGIHWCTCQYDDGAKNPGTWHWTERA